MFDVSSGVVGDVLMEFKHDDSVESVCISQIGGKDYLFTGSGRYSTGKAWMFDISSGEMMKEWEHVKRVCSMCVGRIGGKEYLFTGCYDRKARMYPI
jgi:WD40 repeat protein